MKRQIRRGVLAGALAALVLGVGPSAMQSRNAINVASLGPQVGERVPDFSLPDQTGRMRNLSSILGPNGGILLFHRSADW